MDIQELFDKLPENLQDKIMEMNKPHPLAEIMKPLIKQSKEINNKRKTITYKVISNFASDFFSLRDLKRLEHLLEDYEYMLEYRNIVYSYSYYFYHWAYNNKYRNWYYKRVGDKIYF